MGICFCLSVFMITTADNYAGYHFCRFSRSCCLLKATKYNYDIAMDNAGQRCCIARHKATSYQSLT